MSPLIVSNDFYASKFLMDDLKQSNYEVVFENQLKVKVRSKSLARLLAFMPIKSKEQRDVVAFAIEDIVFLEQIRRCIGSPKVWLWNPICSMTRKNRILFLLYVKVKKIQVWTFDRNDAEKYGFNYFEQVHSEKLIREGGTGGHGAFFSGVDKGRLHKITEIRNTLFEQGIEANFHIVADKGKEYSDRESAYLTKAYIEFDEYLDALKNAEIVVDVNQADQSGITLRVIEAFFLNKKLITTNQNIKKANFYRAENVYIFGHEKRPLCEFLREPLKELSIEKKKPYTTKALIDAMIL